MQCHYGVPFFNEQTKKSKTLELIYSDLNGPHTIEEYRAENFFLTYMVVYSKGVMINCVKNKLDSPKCFR